MEEIFRKGVEALKHTVCMVERVFLFCFIRGVVRNEIEMLHESEKLASEAFACFDGFFHTGASYRKRIEDFYFQFEKQSQGW